MSEQTTWAWRRIEGRRQETAYFARLRRAIAARGAGSATWPRWALVSLIDFGGRHAGQTLFRGLLLSMVIFLVASGLSLIFGLLDVLNFAQGAFLLVGAYVGYATYKSVEASSTISFLAAVGAATVSVGVLGAVIESGLIRPLYERPVFQIVLTFGLGAVLLDLASAWGCSEPAARARRRCSAGRSSCSAEPEHLPVVHDRARPDHHDRHRPVLNPHAAGDLHPRRCRTPRWCRRRHQRAARVHLRLRVGAVLAGLAGSCGAVPGRDARVGPVPDTGDRRVVIGGMGKLRGDRRRPSSRGADGAVAEQMSLKHFNAPVLAETSILRLMTRRAAGPASGLFGRESHDRARVYAPSSGSSTRPAQGGRAVARLVLEKWFYALVLLLLWRFPHIVADLSGSEVCPPGRLATRSSGRA